MWIYLKNLPICWHPDWKRKPLHSDNRSQLFWIASAARSSIYIPPGLMRYDPENSENKLETKSKQWKQKENKVETKKTKLKQNRNRSKIILISGGATLKVETKCKRFQILSVFKIRKRFRNKMFRVDSRKRFLKTRETFQICFKKTTWKRIENRFKSVF